MNLIQLLKGAFKKMISPKTVSDVLHISPAMSTDMKEAIELWEAMYTNNSPWLDKNTQSLNLAGMIASEKARMATLEMDIKITGDNERAEYLNNQFKKVLNSIRKNLEYGIALGGIAIKPYVVKGVNGKYKIEVNYTKATDFYPLSFSPEGDIVECAFVDRVITKDYTYSKVEHHKLSGTKLIVDNLAFRRENNNFGNEHLDTELGEPTLLSNVPNWADLEAHIELDNVDTMLFAYFKMPQANCVDLDSPLGVSGFSRAIDLIKDADKQYSNLLWEFQGGQMAIDVDRTALNIMKDSKGRDTYVLPEMQDRLFRRTLDLGDDNMYNVFAPSLRDKSILNGLNSILMHIEDVCDLSRGTLSNVTYTEARTATELKILKQRSYSANLDIQKELQSCLELYISIMDKYCDLYDIVPSGDYEVSYSWDDSIIIDKDAERQVDLLDVKEGLMSKVEYRMKWYGNTEKQAEEVLDAIDTEKVQEIERNVNQFNTPVERANASGVTTEKIS